MKRIVGMFSLLIFLLGVGFLLFPKNASAQTNLATRLSGKFLLQVESRGELWYVNPTNKKRYFVGRPQDSIRILNNLGLGVSENDFRIFAGVAPARLAGRILLRVQNQGQAYYVDPLTQNIIYLDGPIAAFNVFSEHASGISNTNINTIPTEGEIIVFKPLIREKMMSPYLLRGAARVFENTVNFRLRDADNAILKEGVTTAVAPDIGFYGLFQELFSFPVSVTATGTMEVFSLSARDGSIINLVKIPVKFR